MNTQPIQLDVEQGSDAWFEARRGIPTASNFKRILTATGQRSGAAKKYLSELLREYHNGNAMVREAKNNSWMARGIALEPQARRVYESHTGAAVAQTGVVYLNRERLVAASPDGLVGADGLLEIKCPADETHLSWADAAALPAAHLPQVQGQLWVTGRRWCDFFSYHPGYAPCLVRVARDEIYIGKLREAVLEFVAQLLAARGKGGRRCA